MLNNNIVFPISLTVCTVCLDEQEEEGYGFWDLVAAPFGNEEGSMLQIPCP